MTDRHPLARREVLIGSLLALIGITGALVSIARDSDAPVTFEYGEYAFGWGAYGGDPSYGESLASHGNAAESG